MKCGTLATLTSLWAVAQGAGCSQTLFEEEPTDTAADASGDTDWGADADGDDDGGTDDGADGDGDGADGDGDGEAGDGDGEVAAVCGNGDLEGDEDCDDGNAEPGDGCEADCTFTCTEADDTCRPDRHCDDRTHTCLPGCRSDEGCAAPDPHCDVENHACVACLVNGHCDAGEMCIDHDCVPGCVDSTTCPDGHECCEGGCIDTRTSATHCSGCGRACEVDHGTPVCAAGTCLVGSCDIGYGNCNGDPADGCETDTMTDVASCNACGSACPPPSHAPPVCDGGVCGMGACDPDWGDCDGDPADGCETNLADDNDNCRICGLACTAGAECVGGACRDTTPPDTTITSGPPALTHSTAATFEFTSTEAGSTFQCRVGTGAYGPCTSPYNYSVPADGSYTFYVFAVDGAGNPDPSPATRSWRVDATAPDTTITFGPPALTNSTAATFEFTSTEAGSTFQCRVGTGAYGPCTSPYNFAAPVDGSYTFFVYAVDGAGNPDATPATRSWTVDITPPDTIISWSPASPSGPRVTFQFASTDGGISFQCRVDSGAWGSCTSPVSYSLGAGSHTFEVRSADAAGNTDPTPAGYTWIVQCSELSPDADTIGLWHLNEGSGQTVGDSSAGGRTMYLGTTVGVEIVDPAWTSSGRFGGALEFTRSEGDLVYGNTAWGGDELAGNQLTVELWLRRVAPYDHSYVFWAGFINCAVAVESSGAVYFGIGNGMSWLDLYTTGVDLDDARWHQVTTTYDGATMRVFVDGTERASRAGTIDLANPDEGWIGGRTFNTWMNGTIDEVRFSDIARQGTWILDNYCPPP